MKGKYEKDWVGGKAQRFVLPLCAVPHRERKQRLCEDQNFAAALLMAGCDDADVMRMFDDAERLLQRIRETQGG